MPGAFGRRRAAFPAPFGSATSTNCGATPMLVSRLVGWVHSTLPFDRSIARIVLPSATRVIATAASIATTCSPASARNSCRPLPALSTTSRPAVSVASSLSPRARRIVALIAAEPGRRPQVVVVCCHSTSPVSGIAAGLGVVALVSVQFRRRGDDVFRRDHDALRPVRREDVQRGAVLGGDHMDLPAHRQPDQRRRGRRQRAHGLRVGGRDRHDRRQSTDRSPSAGRPDRRWLSVQCGLPSTRVERAQRAVRTRGTGQGQDHVRVRPDAGLAVRLPQPNAADRVVDVESGTDRAPDDDHGRQPTGDARPTSRPGSTVSRRCPDRGPRPCPRWTR